MSNVTCTDTPCVGGDTDGHESYIRLLSGCRGEETARAECGCHLVQEEDGDVALFRCQEHDWDNAAPFSDRELATLIAALRLWQATRHGEVAPATGVPAGLQEIAVRGDPLLPMLSDADIDLLIQEQLNVAPSQ